MRNIDEYIVESLAKANSALNAIKSDANKFLKFLNTDKAENVYDDLIENYKKGKDNLWTDVKDAFFEAIGTMIDDGFDGFDELIEDDKNPSEDTVIDIISDDILIKLKETLKNTDNAIKQYICNNEGISTLFYELWSNSGCKKF